MCYVKMTPKPVRSFAEMFGHKTVGAFLKAFAQKNGDIITIDNLSMMSFSANQIE